MDPDVSCDLRKAAAVARRARNAFFAATLLCWLLALDVTQLRDRSLGQLESIHAFFGPLLLWSLTAAAYAFQAVVRAYAGVSQRVDKILTTDEAKALRLVTRIRARLSSSASGRSGSATPDRPSRRPPGSSLGRHTRPKRW